MSTTPPANTSLKGLIAAAANDFSRLAKAQIELAQVELKDTGKAVAATSALIIGGITLAALGFIFLLVTLAYVLVAIGLPVWAGFGIVVLLLFIAAVVLFVLGRNRAKSIKGPERFKRELQRTKDALSGQTPPASK